MNKSDVGICSRHYEETANAKNQRAPIYRINGLEISFAVAAEENLSLIALDYGSGKEHTGNIGRQPMGFTKVLKIT
jgi:hypothetical protein